MAVIILSRLNAQVVAINPDLITWIEVTPDTTVSLLSGDKIIVRESLEEVISKIIEFRRQIGPLRGGSAIESLNQKRPSSAPRQSDIPSTRPSTRPVDQRK